MFLAEPPRFEPHEFSPVGPRPQTSCSPACRSLSSLAKNLPLATFLNASPPPSPPKMNKPKGFFCFWRSLRGLNPTGLISYAMQLMCHMKFVLLREGRNNYDNYKISKEYDSRNQEIFLVVSLFQVPDRGSSLVVLKQRKY